MDGHCGDHLRRVHWTEPIFELILENDKSNAYISHGMRFPTMWYVRLAKPQTQPAHMRSLIRAFLGHLKYSMSVNLMTEHNLEFLSLKGGCTGLSESTLAKLPHCWKSCVTAHMDRTLV